jgi:hypothetical protein
VLWGVDTDSIEITQNWSSQKDYDGKTLYSRENVGDFDYVSSNEFGFLFYRENPPDYMFNEVYEYLQKIYGPPLFDRDYTPKIKYKMETSAKVSSGKWKYDKEWHHGNKIIILVWKENKLYVNCLFK